MVSSSLNSNIIHSFRVFPGFLVRIKGDEDSIAVCAVPYEPVDALHPKD